MGRRADYLFPKLEGANYMKKLTLIRCCYTPKGTFGTVVLDEYPICLMLERPLFFGLNGLTTPNISCVPAGLYNIRLTQRHPTRTDGYEVFELLDVEGGNRTHIQIHIGNYIDDSLGCLLPCESWSRTSGGRVMGLSSGVAFRRFMELVKKEGVTEILITDLYQFAGESR